SHAASPSALYALSLPDALPISYILDPDLLAKCPIFHCFAWHSHINCGVFGTDYDLVAFAHDLGQRNLIGGDDLVWLAAARHFVRSEEHTSELQSRENLVCRLLL